MFLFLSKLLPLFVYPIGLSCILLIAALLLAWRKWRWQHLPIAIALSLLLLASNKWVSEAIVRSLEWQYLPPENLPNASAIVLLGGSIGPDYPPRPSFDLSDRADRVVRAADLYRRGKAPIIIASGGRLSWQGSEPPESRDMALFLMRLGVPRSVIIEEPNSLNTYQNAVEVKQILARHNLDRVLLVTSALHMPRSLAIFRKQAIDAIPAPTDFHIVRSPAAFQPQTPTNILFSLLPDTQSLALTTDALKEYIGLVVYRLRGWL